MRKREGGESSPTRSGLVLGSSQSSAVLHHSIELMRGEVIGRAHVLARFASLRVETLPEGAGGGAWRLGKPAKQPARPPGLRCHPISSGLAQGGVLQNPGKRITGIAAGPRGVLRKAERGSLLSLGLTAPGHPPLVGGGHPGNLARCAVGEGTRAERRNRVPADRAILPLPPASGSTQTGQVTGLVVRRRRTRLSFWKGRRGRV